MSHSLGGVLRLQRQSRGTFR